MYNKKKYNFFYCLNKYLYNILRLLTELDHHFPLIISEVGSGSESGSGIRKKLSASAKSRGSDHCSCGLGKSPERVEKGRVHASEEDSGKEAGSRRGKKICSREKRGRRNFGCVQCVVAV